MFSRSINYCYASLADRDSVLLLFEVALSYMNELMSSGYNADKLPLAKLRFHSSHIVIVHIVFLDFVSDLILLISFLSEE
ncbi:hypothetical protein BC332_01076 [Capsicum chinense]|nr:hypothetical protein BC332_01076 [Capsicum chinense]